MMASDQARSVAPGGIPPVVPESRSILGARVCASNYGGAVRLVLSWATTGGSYYVCVSTVHAVMEAHDDPSFREVVNNADLVTSDGMPLVWCLRLLGCPQATRVYGPTLTLHLLRAASDVGIPVAFYGSRQKVLERLLGVVHREYPSLKVAFAEAPPFRPLTTEEDEETVRRINASGARIVFVGLGCPKQERWMAAHRGCINAVMLGVGAAFDFIAGTVPQAPLWMQNAGLEWLFRLIAEPRRLWKRYAVHNPRFVLLFALQLLGRRQPAPRPD